MSAALLVLHAWGDPDGAGTWAPVAGVWDGPVVAPDLPGHRDAPPPTGATYAPGDAALYGDRALRDAGLAGGPVVALGDGSSAFGAELLAAACRVGAVVLVDGLGGPWATVEELTADNARWCRAVSADPAALAPPPPGVSPDPRLRHPFPTVWARDFTESRRAAIVVPVLAVETPASPTPPGEREERLAAFAGPTRCVELPAHDPAGVAGLLRDPDLRTFLHLRGGDTATPTR